MSDPNKASVEGEALVEIAAFPDCPHLPTAREQVRLALAQLGLPERWIERDLGAGDVPAHMRGLGSPTVLVDGADVAPPNSASPADGPCCRVYRDSESRGAPPLEAITRALRRSRLHDA